MMPQALIPLLLLLAATFRSAPGECVLCEEGITLPNKPIAVPGFEAVVKTCADLEFFLPFITNQDCTLLQSVATLCGCPVREESCLLCPDGSIANNSASELPIFSSFFGGGLVPTCELFESYLHSINKTDSLCVFSQSFVGDYCGCPSTASGEPTDDSTNVQECTVCGDGSAVPDPDVPLNITGLPVNTCGELDEAVHFLLTTQNKEECGLVQSIGSLCGCMEREKACSLCPDGSQVTLPDKPVSFVDPLKFGGIKPTCRLYEAYMRSIHQDNDQCGLAQAASGYCGCPPIENHCSLCHGQPVPDGFKNRKVHLLEQDPSFGINPNCELYVALQYQIPSSVEDCSLLAQQSFMCGCEEGTFYGDIGADKEWKKAFLSWGGRITAVLCLLAISAVIYDVFRSKVKRTKVYSQIMVGMGACDMVYCVAWILSTLMTPRTVFGGDPSGIYGAFGNNITCKISGFMVFSFLLSSFYNISLSLYYKLVIVNDWKESRLRRIRKWLHGIPILIGLIFMSAGIPYYKRQFFGCFLHGYSSNNWAQVLFLFFMPIATSLLVITALTIQVYCHVYTTTSKSRKWTFTNRKLSLSTARESDHHSRTSRRSQESPGMRGSSASHLLRAGLRASARTKSRVEQLEREVFSHALCYMLSFWMTWPIVVVAMFKEKWKAYWFGVVVVALVPCQALLNTIVYFRPHVSRWCKLRKKRMEKMKQQQPQLAVPQEALSKVASRRWRLSTLFGRRFNGLFSPTDRTPNVSQATPYESYASPPISRVSEHLPNTDEDKEGEEQQQQQQQQQQQEVDEEEEFLDFHDSDPNFEIAADLLPHRFVQSLTFEVTDLAPQARAARSLPFEVEGHTVYMSSNLQGNLGSERSGDSPSSFELDFEDEEDWAREEVPGES